MHIGTCIRSHFFVEHAGATTPPLTLTHRHRRGTSLAWLASRRTLLSSTRFAFPIVCRAALPPFLPSPFPLSSFNLRSFILFWLACLQEDYLTIYFTLYLCLSQHKRISQNEVNNNESLQIY
ncbi:hypothetical protein FA13DRAFT_196408 [Coprinellus micaceus]|uniref:Uncharacterized protein n=1 Tax=Coprinellus micaceus TaxID=71717 RepID=A0A4Y7TH54_COPMI|nr:hypothetical protein FA13DRAFT_196408 [Coprinellus micaceus]